jgi:hypothetical protein
MTPAWLVRIDEFGPRAQMDRDRRQSRYVARLRELGQVTFTRIEVEPSQSSGSAPPSVSSPDPATTKTISGG